MVILGRERSRFLELVSLPETLFRFAYTGFDIAEIPCYDQEGKDITETMIAGVKRYIDEGKPALGFILSVNEI